MSASIARYRRSAVPWVLAACVCMGIIATVLLSNDKRHLRSLLAFYDIPWPFENAAPSSPLQGPAARQKRLAAPRVLLHPRLATPVLRDEPTLFIRLMPEDGPALCAALAESGIVMDGPVWGEVPHDRSLSGCQSMIVHEGEREGEDADRGASSLFVDVKGRASGQVTLIRMKMVLGRGAGASAIREQAAGAFTLLTESAGWTDFSAMAGGIRRMEEFSLSASGIGVSMRREPSNPAGFNIFVQQTDKAPALLQARRYFDAARHGMAASRIFPSPVPSPARACILPDGC